MHTLPIKNRFSIKDKEHQSNASGQNSSKNTAGGATRYYKMQAGEGSNSVLCRARRVTEAVMPGDSVMVDVHSLNLPDGSVVAVEPRYDTKTFANYQWPCLQTSTVIAGEMSLVNDSDSPIMVYKNDHICQVRSTTEVTPFNDSSPSPSKTSPIARSVPCSSEIIIDNQLNREQK